MTASTSTLADAGRLDGSHRFRLRLSAILATVGADVLRVHRMPDPDVVVSGVVLYGDGDPAPPDDHVVLCAAPVPALGPVVVVRENAAATLAAPDATAVLTAPDRLPWIDVFDAIRRCFADQVTEAAEDDLFALADALAAATGGAVAIEDADRRILAFSTIPGQPIDPVRRDGILGRQVPEHVERDEWYRLLWRTDGVVEYQPGPESSARLAVAVRAGGEQLGSIWVVGDRSSLADGADDALVRSVPTVARCLLHQQRFSSRTRDARATLLRRLLTAGPTAETEIGDLTTRPVVVVAISQNAPCPDRELLDMRLADLLSLHAHRAGNAGLSAVLDDTVYAVLPWVDRRHLDQQLAAALARTPYPTRAAVSDVVTDAADLTLATRAVDRLLALMTAENEPPVRYAADNQHRLVLAAIGDAIGDRVPEIRAGLVAHIRDYDAAHTTNYAPTLRAWFDTNGDVAAGAKLLHVHPNTFRYRISRAVDLFDIDFDDADQRLLLHLQLRVVDPTSC